MSTFTCNDNTIFYTIEGDGEPLVLVNGIVMHTKSWDPVAPSLCKNNTLIRLDLLDQGQTSKQDCDYTIDDQVAVIKALLEHLNIEKAHILGASYGGYVAIRFTVLFPEMVDRLILTAASPYVSKRDNEMFKVFQESAKNLPALGFYLSMIPTFYSEDFYETHYEGMLAKRHEVLDIFESEVFRSSIIRLSHSCLDFDERLNLEHITAKTLIISGSADVTMTRQKQEILCDLINDSNWIEFPNVGHALPYQNPFLFTSVVGGFLNNE